MEWCCRAVLVIVLPVDRSTGLKGQKPHHKGISRLGYELAIVGLKSMKRSKVLRYNPGSELEGVKDRS